MTWTNKISQQNLNEWMMLLFLLYLCIYAAAVVCLVIYYPFSIVFKVRTYIAYKFNKNKYCLKVYLIWYNTSCYVIRTSDNTIASTVKIK